LLSGGAGESEESGEKGGGDRLASWENIGWSYCGGAVMRIVIGIIVLFGTWKYKMYRKIAFKLVRVGYWWNEGLPGVGMR